MNLAAVLIPPSLDAKQSLRLRRFGLAASSYVLATALVAIAWSFGVLPASAALKVAAAFLAINLALYAVIRSGFNLRFEDPSLTRFQILVAITVLMYVVYHMDDGRSVALFGCFFVFLFGIFRLNAREFTVVTLYALAAYALVIFLLMHLRPQAIQDVPREWMSWLGLAGFLPFFTVIGGQINTLRRKLRQSEMRYRSLTELSSDWYWEQDENLRLTRMSRPNAGQQDIEADTFLGKTRREAKDVVWDESQLVALEAIVAARQPFRDFEIGRTYRNGPRRYVQMSGEPIVDASGRFSGYRGIGKDISERKEREEDLRRFHTAMDATEDAIYLVDRASMRIVDVNSAACNMLGLTREQILSAGPEGVLSMSREDLVRIYDAVIAGGGATQPVEMLRMRPGGEQAWMEVRRHATQSEAGWTIVTVARDITERKRAEDALHESEARFRSLTEMSSDFYWESDVEHRVTMRGSAGAGRRVSVFQRRVQIGERRWEAPYLSPDEAGWQAHRAVLDAHRPFRDFEFSRVGTGGTERHISISGNPVFDVSGAFKGYRGVGKDITEQVRRIDDLRRLRAAMDATIDSVYLTDPATMRFVEVNSAACRRLGYTREQLLELGPQDVLVADGEQLRRLYNEVIAAGEQGTRAEMHYLTSDGRRGWTELHRHALRSGSGWLIVTLGRDITERKRAEEAMRESEVQLKGILESTTDGILAVDGKGKVIRANRRFAELWRIPKPLLDTGDDQALLEFVGSQLNDAGDFVNKVHGLYASDAEDMDTLTFKDGRIFERLSFPLILDGAILGRVWSFRDITERRRGEEALQQKHARLLQTEQELRNAHEALAEADRLESVGRLAAGVAHEVKNPLTIIRLGADYLAKQSSQESNLEVLDDIRGAIDRAERVIRDLLDFSRQKPFAPRRTNINEVIDNAIRLTRHEIKRRDIVIMRNRDDLMPPIFADPDRLVQVLINLLTNAAQAIGQDGSIEIVTRSICLSERDLEQSETSMLRIGEPAITVDIRDNGPGISPGHEKKLFEPFFTTKPVGEGSGLGLSVSRSIVIMHRGSIRISNRPEGGASALLMLRVDQERLTNEKANTGSG
jgi:PAS domain S-box-containing protein